MVPPWGLPAKNYLKVDGQAGLPDWHALFNNWWSGGPARPGFLRIGSQAGLPDQHSLRICGQAGSGAGSQ